MNTGNTAHAGITLKKPAHKSRQGQPKRCPAYNQFNNQQAQQAHKTVKNPAVFSSSAPSHQPSAPQPPPAAQQHRPARSHPAPAAAGSQTRTRARVRPRPAAAAPRLPHWGAACTHVKSIVAMRFADQTFHLTVLCCTRRPSASSECPWHLVIYLAIRSMLGCILAFRVHLVMNHDDKNLCSPCVLLGEGQAEVRVGCPGGWLHPCILLKGVNHL